jgi:hypothetical protein
MMKKIWTIFILFASVQSSYAQWAREWSIGYAYSDPTGKMKHNINQGHGIVRIEGRLFRIHNRLEYFRSG